MANDLTIYNSVKDRMGTGDGLDFLNVGAVSDFIAWWTRKDVDPKNQIRLSHFGGLVRAGLYEGKDERRFTMEAMSIGFYPDMLSKYIINYPGHIYWYQLKPEWDQYRNEIGCQILSMIGTNYDWLGVAKQLIMKVSESARRLWCSEAWEIGLQNVAPKLCADVKGIGLSPAGMWKLGTYKDPVKLI
jgi:hypothetical protein